MSPGAQETSSGTYSSWLTAAVHRLARPAAQKLVRPRPRCGERLAHGRFELLEEIGSGAMGVVFRALDRKLERAIAIKLLLAGEEGASAVDQALLRQEARAVARLNHANIVQVFDLHLWRGQPFLTMECLEGETLARRMGRQRVPALRALEIVAAVVRGLAHAHERQVVHRDVKPSNVFLLADGRVKLLDFGLSHAVGRHPDPGGGTPLYMAPEQWRGGPQDGRTDLWAAGVILFELLAGRHPFPGRGAAAVRQQVLSEEAPPALDRPDLPRAVADLVARAMSKRPSGRPETARKLLAELETLQGQLSSRPESGGPPTMVAEPERRQVTMVCCRLSGLAHAAPGERPPDVEQVHAVQRRFRDLCMDAMRACEARVLAYSGDHLLGCLGYPAAHEDDAQRAVRAALQISSAARSQELSVRIGVHTGSAVVEQHPDHARDIPWTVLGDVPMLARRLVEEARDDGVVASDATRQLLRGLFAVERAGATTSRVLGENAGCSRFDPGPWSAPTPLIGRERELATLAGLWSEAKAGRGRVLLLSGEAGIGKSRLAQALKDLAQDEGNTRLTGQCWQHHSTSAFRPLIELLLRSMNIGRLDPPEEKLAKIESNLRLLGMSLEEQVPLFAALLSVPLDPAHAPAALSGSVQKERTMEALLEILRRMSARKPLVLAIEDLHWIDPSSMEVVSRLVGQIAGMRALLVLTHRPGVAAPWRAGGHVAALELEGLAPDQAAQMVLSVAGGALPAQWVEKVVAQADGTPLFVEELTRMALQQCSTRQGGGTLAEAGEAELLAIPPRLHELLLARLGILTPAEKEVAQVAAAIGRQFSHDLLARSARLEGEVLRSGLAQLVRYGFLDCQGPPPATLYRFRHALIQEAIYQSSLTPRRQSCHQRVAEALEELQPELVEVQPELLAHHYEEAAHLPRAIALWEQAGLRAARRFAHTEAIDSFRRALALLGDAPALPDHAQKEVDLLLGIGASLMATRGYAAPEVEVTYERARKLCCELNVPGQMFPALQGLWQYYMSRSTLRIGRQLAEQLVGMAEGSGAPVQLLPAYRALGTNLFLQGEIGPALGAFERVISADDVSLGGAMIFNGQDHRLMARSYAAWSHYLLGSPELAVERLREALALAEGLQHPLSVAFVRSQLMAILLQRGQYREVVEQAERSTALCSDHRIHTWFAWADVHRGYALCRLGQPDEGIRLLRQGLNGWKQLGTRAALTYLLPLLSEALLARGDVEGSFQPLDEAQGVLEQGGEHFYESRLHQVRAQALLARGAEHRPQARACLERALEVARRQGARTHELTATEALAALDGTR